jgi:hypothetical protein
MARSKAAGAQHGKQLVRYAVIGLGHISQAAVLPAFAHAKRNSVLSALVSDDTQKLRNLARRYAVQRVCSYAEVDELFASGDIDAVYIALPNDMHKEYTLKAARAGLHVLCEKPMAVSSRECEQMLRATRHARVKLAKSSISIVERCPRITSPLPPPSTTSVRPCCYGRSTRKRGGFVDGHPTHAGCPCAALARCPLHEHARGSAAQHRITTLLGKPTTSASVSSQR